MIKVENILEEFVRDITAILIKAFFICCIESNSPKVKIKQIEMILYKVNKPFATLMKINYQNQNTNDFKVKKDVGIVNYSLTKRFSFNFMQILSSIMTKN